MFAWNVPADDSPSNDPVLEVYLLGQVPFVEMLWLQRRLVYEISGERHRAALCFCEHPPTITIGRAGSVRDVGLTAAELEHLGCRVFRVNRGGGTTLHLPGQLAIYPIVPLDALDLTVGAFVERLKTITHTVLQEYELLGLHTHGAGGHLVGSRQLTQVGIAVRQWVSYYGLTVNLNPELLPYKQIACDGRTEPMTSVERELRVPVRAARFRQRFLEQFTAAFAYQRQAILHHHPALAPRANQHAVTTGSSNL